MQRHGRLRSHAVRLHADALQHAALPGGLLVLPDPDGGQLSYDYVSHTRHPSGDLTWVGRAQGAPLGQEALLTVGPHAAFGQLPRPDGSVMEVETVGGKVRLVVDEGFALGEPAHMRVHDVLRPPMASLAAAPSRRAAAPVDRLQGDPTRVDVMLAYTPGLAAYVGGDAAMLTMLHNRIDYANQALANANVSGSLRLVATPRVDVPDTGNNSTVLREITDVSYEFAPPAAFQLATLRHRHGADIVGLVRLFQGEESASCGVGWVGGYNGSPMANSVEFAYFLASHGVAGESSCSGSRIVAHEIGHNLGQNHDIVSSGNVRDGAHTYSHGYRISPPGKTGFNTVMAYREADQVPALTYSNPDLVRADCANEACGLVDANVAASLNLTIPGAAAWIKAADEADRDILGTSGHLMLDLSGLPALTDARWRAEFTGPGSVRVTGPTTADAGAPLQARLAWDALPATIGVPIAVRVVVESSPGVFAGERNLTLHHRRQFSAARLLAEGVPTTVSVPVRIRSAAEGRMYVPVPPHARHLRISVSSDVAVELYATLQADWWEHAFFPLIGPGVSLLNPLFLGDGTANEKQLDIDLSWLAMPEGTDYRILVAVAQPSLGSDSPGTATVTASFPQHDPAPAFQSGQYYNPDRSGHGVFVDFANDQWVAVWYTYLEDGTPTWYYSEAPAPAAGGPGIWSAPLMRVGWNGSATHSTEVGRMQVTPMDPTTMLFSYNLDGDSGSERLVRLGGGSGCPTSDGAPLDATGHWFSPGLSGFGYSAQFEPDQEIYTAYLYDAAGVARWLIGAKPWNEAVTDVAMEQITGSCPTCGYASTASSATGQLTRTLGQNADGKRGLGQVTLSAPLLAPLSGSWSQSRATELLSARKDCL